jgi:hypothetical protein
MTKEADRVPPGIAATLRVLAEIHGELDGPAEHADDPGERDEDRRDDGTERRDDRLERRDDRLERRDDRLERRAEDDGEYRALPVDLHRAHDAHPQCRGDVDLVGQSDGGNL